MSEVTRQLAARKLSVISLSRVGSWPYWEPAILAKRALKKNRAAAELLQSINLAFVVRLAVWRAWSAQAVMPIFENQISELCDLDHDLESHVSASVPVCMYRTLHVPHPL